MVTAESEKEIEKRVLELIKKQSIEMETRTGVENVTSDSVLFVLTGNKGL
jgi:NADH dehydrogenase FAD-containing subunit